MLAGRRRYHLLISLEEDPLTMQRPVQAGVVTDELVQGVVLQ